MIEDPELQVNGFILIIDWSNFTFKQASRLTPSMLRLAIEGLQVGSTYAVLYVSVKITKRLHRLWTKTSLSQHI
jgi:hypothetical protein